MTNADMPAMPGGSVQKRRQNPNDPGSDFFVAAFSEPKNAGLTKREHIAAIAMQGLLASDAEGGLSKENCVKLAVEHADALLSELEKQS